jgi:mannose-6-phosphate isomerase-like protein (cupin superfamily)
MYLPHDAKEQPISAAERQELLEHLKHSQAAFAAELRGLSAEQARFKPAPDRWSILDCAEHLAQAEQLLFNDAMAGLKLPTGGKSTVTTEAILNVWGTRTQKVKSSGEYDPKGRWPDLPAAQRAFEERRAKTIQFVTETQADLRGRICCDNLDIWQQLLALSAHTLRHVQQMEEVKADAAYPKTAPAQSFRLDQLTVQREKSGKPWLQFLNVPSMRMGVYALTAGGDDKQSPHAEDEVYYVTRGRAVLRVGAEDIPVAAGSVVYVAAHVEHKFHSIAEPLEVLVFFAAAKDK